MKLFPKLTLVISGLLIGTIFALCASFYLAERASIRAEADAERRVVLQNLAHITRESILTNDDLLLVKYTRWLQKWNPALTSLSVTSPQGRVLAHSEPRQIGSLNEKKGSADMSTGSLLVLSQAVHLAGRWVASVTAGFSAEKTADLMHVRLRGVKQRLASVAFGAVILGIIVSFLLAHSWTKPIQTLARVAEHIGKGEFRQNLSEPAARADELGSLAQSFQRMSKNLLELDAMKEDFVSAVTHELRSPLGAIESYLNLMREEMLPGTFSGSWPVYINRLQANTHRLTRFVNDLLDVGALERGKIELACSPLDVQPLIEEVITFYGPKLSEKSLLCVAPKPTPPLPKVWADADKVRQVLVNLLSNAIKFTPPGGSIGISLETAGAMALVHVQDTGIGIPENDQKRIFKKFEQVAAARQTLKGPKGTGLGLALSKLLIEQHGGRMSVASRPGVGSTFTFTLPTSKK